MSGSSHTKRRMPRPLLLAGAGLTALSFSQTVACGGPAGTTVCPASTPGCSGGFGSTSGFGGTTGGTTGSIGSTTGQAIQYCGLPDGGTPIPCDELDGGDGSPDGG